MTLAPTSAGLPFFDPRHRALEAELTEAAVRIAADGLAPAELARALGHRYDLYRFLLPEAHGGVALGRAGDTTHVEVRALVLVRELLGAYAPAADAIFAVQGLGSYPIVLAGSPAQRARYLPLVLRGESVGAFALTEPEAGSDVAALQTRAVRDGDGWVLDGEKTLISNAPIADHLVVFARTDAAQGSRGITAFVVDARAGGLTVEAQAMSVDHPLGQVHLRSCRVPDEARIGEIGAGFKLAMQTLETFRVSVGAAANGMATAALGDALDHVQRREQFGAPLANQQIVQGYLADMATWLDAGRLLVARAAHATDTVPGRHTAAVAMAKMYATERAQRIVDLAVQLHGGRGVLLGSRVEELYRAVRALRIYEGATEVQKVIIARTLLSPRAERRT